MKKVLALVIGMLLISSVAFAKDIAQGTIGVTGASSFTYNSLTVENGDELDVSLMAVNLQANYFIMPNIGVGGLIGYQSVDAEDTEISAMTVGAVAIYNFSLSPQLSLFANGMAGYMSVSNSEDMSGFTFSAGGGVKYFLVDNVSLDAFINYAYASLEDTDIELTISGISVGAGLSVYFK